jgi:glycerophosphoryl diester phosphodiesterase
MRATRGSHGALLLTLAAGTVWEAAAPAAGNHQGDAGSRRQSKAPIVIGHRGASGHRPEHTLEAYRLAIEQGADFIEPDLVPTRDGVLVARHENEISGTTDVADHPEFRPRFATKRIDGVAVSGYFTEDFSLAELKTLRAKERLPRLRGTGHDGRYAIPALQEIIHIVVEWNARLEPGVRRIGLYPEIKHPSYFDSIGLSVEQVLVEALHENGIDGRQAPVFIQSFEVATLKALSRATRVPLVQLINAGGKPYDFVLSGDPRTYADLATPAGLLEIATYAQGIGVSKDLVLPRDAQGRLLPATSLIPDAHRAGLLVHGWTFRAENEFLPAAFQIGRRPEGTGDMFGEALLFLDAGLDGYFTDHPGLGVAARDAFVRKRH